MTETITISNRIKGKPPGLPFIKIKEHILPREYELSLVFIGSKRSRSLNKKYRKKDYPANVLSFPLSDSEGEIFIDLKEAYKSSKKFGMTREGFVGYLFIHALLHLKGYNHGSKMEKQEKVILKLFHLT